MPRIAHVAHGKHNRVIARQKASKSFAISDSTVNVTFSLKKTRTNHIFVVLVLLTLLDVSIPVDLHALRIPNVGDFLKIFRCL